MDRSTLRERMYRLGILGKGIDAFLELAGGIMLLLSGADKVHRWAQWLTAGELHEDPHDKVAHLILRESAKISISGEHFFAFYLLVHGVVKAVAVTALVKRKLWAYPMSIVVFCGFIAYQMYRYTLTHSAWLVALSVFDAAVVWLIWLEFRSARRERNGHRADRP